MQKPVNVHGNLYPTGTRIY